MHANYQDLARFEVPPGFRGRSGFVVQLWWLVQAMLVNTSPQAFYGWRAFWWRVFGAKLGRGARIRSSARVCYPWKVSMGDYCWLGDRAELYSLDNITIGNNVCISQDAYICTGSHNVASREFSYDCRPIVIEDEAWVAAGAFVGPGVTIGRAAVLAARSVTMKSLDGLGIYAGQPARFIRKRVEP